MKVMGNNVAHLESKLESFEDYLRVEKPSVFMLQETKMSRQGKIKTNSSKEYIIYELLRQKKKLTGGGLAIGVLKSFQPSFVSKGDDEIEALTVEVWVNDFPIRLVVAYGPQDGDRDHDAKEHKNVKLHFWDYIETEFIEAKKSGAGFLLQMDGNIHAGNAIVPGDPNEINDNGKMFKAFLDRNKELTVCNALSVCQGTITRRRLTTKKEEKAILDFFICCDKLRPYVIKMKIDENGEHSLTNFKPAKHGKKAKPSDHAVLEIVLDLKFSKGKPNRKEMFNFKNVKCQEVFSVLTSETDVLSKCFDGRESINKKTEKWWAKLNSFFHRSLKKIRITHDRKRTENELDKKNERMEDD